MFISNILELLRLKWAIWIFVKQQNILKFDIKNFQNEDIKILLLRVIVITVIDNKTIKWWPTKRWKKYIQASS